MLIPASAPAMAPAQPLSSLHSLSSHYFLLPSPSFLPPGGRPLRRGDLAIRMGGGPRTYPGGVSKWQWKRMQAKKARQLLKARLARERQLYEMRKRAELRDAVAHLERPWDPAVPDAAAVAPNLLSVAADDQLRALADRFHRPGGVDLWNDRDGPRVFSSPATGASSARFFPKNSVYSVQPYALPGAGDEAGAPAAGGNAAHLLLGRVDGDDAQGACENAVEQKGYGIGDNSNKLSVELMGKDGTWEPVQALDNTDVGNAGDWSSDDDDSVVTSESEGTADVSWHEQRAMVRRNGRNNIMAGWEAASIMAAGSDDDRCSSGDAFFSSTEGARQGYLEQRWHERSGTGSRRKHPSGRRGGLSAMEGSSAAQSKQMSSDSFSDSEVIRGGSEPKWRMRNRDDTMNDVWRSNAPRNDWASEEFDSYSDNARGVSSEQKWRARNSRGRPKLRFNANSNDGERPRRYTRGKNDAEHTIGSNGSERHRFGCGIAEDMEAPTWKPRRMNRARNNNSGRDNSTGRRRYRSGDNGAAGRSQANPTDTHRDIGGEHGSQRASRNGGQRFRGDEYSLRPTSELHSSWREKTLEE
ncbi:hypothetical protein ACP70R_026804 [Stipagrostis hirtigluma subsp. patula]